MRYIIFGVWILLFGRVFGTISRPELLPIKTMIIVPKDKHLIDPVLLRFLSRQNITYEELNSIEFLHAPIAPKVLLKDPDKHRFHPRTKFDLTRTKDIIQNRRDLTWEKISRWQNHLQIYLNLLTSSEFSETAGPFLILENFVHLRNDTFQFLNTDFLSQTLPKDWELFILDDLFHTCFSIKSLSIEVPLSTSPQLCRVQSTFGIHGYLLRDINAIRTLVRYLNTKLPRPYDLTVSRLLESRKLVAYRVTDSTSTPITR